MSAANVLGITGAVVIMVTLFEMLRRHRLREKYALIWFLIALLALVFAAVPQLLLGLTNLLGVQVPVNLVFFVGSLVLFLMSLQHSSELGRLEERTRTLAEEVAVLRLDLSRARPEEPAASPSPRASETTDAADPGADG
jgi:hypothetical protein